MNEEKIRGDLDRLMLLYTICQSPESSRKEQEAAESEARGIVVSYAAGITATLFRIADALESLAYIEADRLKRELQR